MLGTGGCYQLKRQCKCTGCVIDNQEVCSHGGRQEEPCRDYGYFGLIFVVTCMVLLCFLIISLSGI